LGKADSVSGKANRVSQVASGLHGLAYGYLSYLDALSAKVSLSQGGRPMRKFSGEAS
jgi:glutamate synthase domain-containing protein 2